MTVNKWSTTAATNATADGSINWAEGQAPSSVNDSARAMMAALAKYRDDNAGSLLTGGTSTAYTLTSNQGFASLSAMSGHTVTFEAHATSGASPTLNVDSLGAKALKSVSGTALPTGYIVAGGVYSGTYSNGDAEWVIHGVPGAIGSLSALTVTGASTFGGLLTVSSGGAAITGNSTVTGTLTTSGALTVSSGGAAVTGNSTVNGTLTSSSTLTASSGFTVSAGAVSLPSASVADGALALPGAWKYLATVSASNSATVDIETTAAFDGTYDRLYVIASNVKVQTDDVTMNMRVKSGGSYVSGASDYTWGNQIVTNGSEAANGDDADSEITFTNSTATAGIGNATGEAINFELWFDSPDTTDYHWFRLNGAYDRAGSGGCYFEAGGRYNTLAAITGIRFFASSGNIVSGDFRIYGLKKS